ncbi:hypothetical protein CMUST_10385 [Corynebacterium mustelae]|uniref:Aerotolerance regulator N-terminal domain-containing protein n=1 Tax=Corynebacterium mustelae TaxID=571915 RepID=A0A0G3H3I6_9CORY|nr:hypothetical protein CMUST_10385 [Corynebacterium mustelae]
MDFRINPGAFILLAIIPAFIYLIYYDFFRKKELRKKLSQDGISCLNTHFSQPSDKSWFLSLEFYFSTNIGKKISHSLSYFS